MKKIKMFCVALGASFMIGGSVSAAETEFGVCVIGVESPCNGSGVQTVYSKFLDKLSPSVLAKLLSNAHNAFDQSSMPEAEINKLTNVFDQSSMPEAEISELVNI